jgi:hypothetical protein
MNDVTFSALWIGPELGPMHAACLRSFGLAGARIKLYVYDRPTDVPENVELADANRILKSSRIFRHKASNSFAVFCDLFRYHLLRSTPEIYVDCDIYCLKPIRYADYIFGMEDENLIANGVLRIPPDSDLLKKMIHVASSPIVFPPWIGRRPAVKAIWRNMLGDGPTARHLPWGATGPNALTHYARQFGLMKHASPPTRFYPVGWQEVAKLFDPGLKLADVITGETDFVHLSNEVIRRESFGEPAKGCILYNLTRNITS